jgi:hypothetical protein
MSGWTVQGLPNATEKQEDIRELKQNISSLIITSASLHHHFLCFFVYLGFVAGLVILSTEFTKPTIN